jgi:hypothetical protein
MTRRAAIRSTGVLVVSLGGFVCTACAPPDPPIAQELQAEHPGCELLETVRWQSDPSTLYVRINYRCPNQEPQWETWMYQEHQGLWKRFRALPGKVSIPRRTTHPRREA